MGQGPREPRRHVPISVKGGTMPTEDTIVVAVEDLPTAGIVGVDAAHVAIEIAASRLVLLHVLDQHLLAGTVLGASGYCPAVGETLDEGVAVLDAAEQALRAEFAALGKPVPAIRRVVAEGQAADAIKQAIAEHNAAGVVLGARRPHAFGRLLHPDVREHLAGHTACRIHVAALQAAPTPAQM